MNLRTNKQGSANCEAVLHYKHHASLVATSLDISINVFLISRLCQFFFLLLIVSFQTAKQSCTVNTTPFRLYLETRMFVLFVLKCLSRLFWNDWKQVSLYLQSRMFVFLGNNNTHTYISYIYHAYIIYISSNLYTTTTHTHIYHTYIMHISYIYHLIYTLIYIYIYTTTTHTHIYIIHISCIYHIYII